MNKVVCVIKFSSKGETVTLLNDKRLKESVLLPGDDEVM